MSLTHTLKQDIMWSAAFSSSSPGFEWPLLAFPASAYQEREREERESKERRVVLRVMCT